MILNEHVGRLIMLPYVSYRTTVISPYNCLENSQGQYSINMSGSIFDVHGPLSVVLDGRGGGGVKGRKGEKRDSRRRRGCGAGFVRDALPTVVHPCRSSRNPLW